MSSDTLTRGQVRKVSQALRTRGRKLPKHGRCVTIWGEMRPSWEPHTRCLEVCRDRRGYYLVGQESHIHFQGARSRGINLGLTATDEADFSAKMVRTAEEAFRAGDCNRANVALMKAVAHNRKAYTALEQARDLFQARCLRGS